MQHKKPKKHKFISVRVSDIDIQTLEAIRYHYECEGIKLNLSKFIREGIMNLPH